MKLLMFVDLVTMVVTWILAYALYPAVPAKPDLYYGILVLTVALGIASSIGVRGVAMQGGEVQVSLWKVIKEAPRWTFGGGRSGHCRLCRDALDLR